MVLPEERYTVSSYMAANIDNYDLFNIMSYALNKDNITPDNLSSEEYLYGSFKIIPLKLANGRWYMKIAE